MAGRWSAGPAPPAVAPLAIGAVVELDRRLRLYPQFGDPLTDLPTLGVTKYGACVPPLYVKYVIDDTRQQS